MTAITRITAQPPAATPSVAKVFTTGRSQAVRLPKEFRFDTKEVTIERQGNAVVLRPKLDSATWAQQVTAAVAAFGPDFNIERGEEWTQPDREKLLP